MLFTVAETNDREGRFSEQKGFRSFWLFRRNKKLQRLQRWLNLCPLV